MMQPTKAEILDILTKTLADIKEIRKELEELKKEFFKHTTDSKTSTTRKHGSPYDCSIRRLGRPR